MLITHGCMWIMLRVDESISLRARKIAVISALLTVVLFVVAGLWSYNFNGYVLNSLAPSGAFNTITGKSVSVVEHGLFLHYVNYPVTVVVPALAGFGMLCAGIFAFKGNAVKGIIASSVGIAFTIITAGAALFPFILPSSKDVNSSLTIWDATSSHFTLQVMLYAVIVFVPLALAYTIWAYYRMWGKASVDTVKEDH